MVRRGPTPPHGTLRRYRGPWKCRCETCRAANAEGQYRRRRGLDPLDPGEVVPGPRSRSTVEHGTRSCYSRGCRREECVAANRAYARRYKRNRGGDGYPLPGYRELKDLDEYLGLR